MQEELRLTVVALEQESRVAGASPTGHRRGARVALVVFVVVVVAAVPLYLWRGRHQWFYLDEWDFLAGRDATNLHDLLRPHNEHWSTVPILVYRFMWRLFGLQTYKPYQLMTIGLHLVAACLLRVVMRRADVRPWIATVAASLFVLLGAGHENIVWAFQIGFVASLVCGLVHLILADHDGRFARRDAIGVAFGGLGLMCSGVGVTMVAVVGLAVLIRRGLKMAALHVAPLAVLFLAWWSVFGRNAYSSPDTSVSSVVRFVGIGIGHTFAELGQVRFVGIALAGLLVVGLVCAVRGDFVTPLRARLAAPIGLLGGGVVYLIIVGLGRIAKADIAIRLGVIGSVDDTARAGRYVHILALLTLPALAVAAHALVQRSRPRPGRRGVAGAWDQREYRRDRTDRH